MTITRLTDHNGWMSKIVKRRSISLTRKLTRLKSARIEMKKIRAKTITSVLFKAIKNPIVNKRKRLITFESSNLNLISTNTLKMTPTPKRKKKIGHSVTSISSSKTSVETVENTQT